MKEQDIQSKIKNTLTGAGWLVRKIVVCSDSGWPDLEAFKAGRTVHIECKKPGEKPTPLQVYRMEQLRKYGIDAFPAWGVDDIRHLV